MGFVHYCEAYAKAIEEWLDEPEQADDVYPGVLEYEVIEPMGEWLLQNEEILTVEQVLEKFKVEYAQFLQSGEGEQA